MVRLRSRYLRMISQTAEAMKAEHGDAAWQFAMVMVGFARTNRNRQLEKLMRRVARELTGGPDQAVAGGGKRIHLRTP